jgi:molybdate transport system substrate-binding protein
MMHRLPQRHTFIKSFKDRALTPRINDAGEMITSLHNHFIKVVLLILLSIGLSFTSSTLASTISPQNNPQLNKTQLNNAPLRIAVASNFAPLLKALLIPFEKNTQIQTQLISGSTGTLYLQIKHGAPFDIFIAGDSKRPALLEQENLILQNSRNTYALGQLALFSQDNLMTLDNLITLDNVKTTQQRFAIANPDTAPYGKAAKETLQHLNLWSSFVPKLITGINVNQTFTQLRSKAVYSGLVANSLLVFHQLKGVVIPSNFHQPIKQQLVIIKNSSHHKAAEKLSNYLLSTDVQQKIIAHGYLSFTPLNEVHDD